MSTVDTELRGRELKIAVTLIIMLTGIAGYLMYIEAGVWGVVAGATLLGAIVAMLYGATRP